MISTRRSLPIEAILVMVLLGIFISVIVAVCAPKRTQAWGSENPNSAHYSIINKAVEYLRRKDLLSDWPLEVYTSTINYGAYFADFPYDPVGLKCDWAGLYEGTCDALHHYRSGDCIHLTDGGVCIGDGGGLGAPDYGQTLYELAVQFWPGGMPVPDIHDLPLRYSGGSMTTLFDGAELGPFVVGGHPFAYDIVCQANCGDAEDLCLCFVEDAYRWPGFVGANLLYPLPRESIQSSLTYLGWAIHLVEDLSTPVHAKNETGSYHRTFEDRADELISDGRMSHLPVDPGGSYSFVDTAYDDYPVSPDFFNTDWTIAQFAQEAARRSIEAETPPWSDGSWGVAMDDQIEIDLDTSIKLVAGVLFKFFSQYELQQDVFEQGQANDTEETAAEIDTGRYEDLTIHAPLDDDFYSLSISEDFSDVRIILNYDRTQHDGELALDIRYRDCVGEGCPWVLADFRATDSGWIYEENSVPAGREYSMMVSALDLRPFAYSMQVYAGRGDLPYDRHEDNNSEDTAKEFSPYVCDYTGELNIHSDGDRDYYYVNAEGFSVETSTTT